MTTTPTTGTSGGKQICDATVRITRKECGHKKLLYLWPLSTLWWSHLQINT